MVETVPDQNRLNPRESTGVQELVDFQPQEDSTLDFRGTDTQYSTHSFHTYLAAMVPGLAQKLVNSYVRPGGTVLDPFCGGGAVLVETVLSGRRAIGFDINELALMVSKAKTTFIKRSQIEAASRLVLDEARNYSGPSIFFDDPKNVEYWFKPYMFGPLSALRLSIDKFQDSKKSDLHNFFRVVFSATVRNVSLTYRNEIRLRRMNEAETKAFNPDVFLKFEEKLAEATDRVSALPIGVKANVGKLDIRTLHQPRYKNIADAIVCSPPYGDERNGVPYTQFAKNMLFWLGFSSDQIANSKNLSLGWGKRKRTLPRSKTLFNALDKIEAYPESVTEAINFYADYFDALNGMANAAKDRVIIVIGQRVLRDTIFDNGKITAELMAEIGVGVEEVFLRKLPSKRLPKMRNYGAAINTETILIFKK